MKRWLSMCVGTLLLSGVVWADGAGDNLPDNVRPIPPRGIAIEPKDAEELHTGIQSLGKEIDALPGVLKDKPALLELLPDVEVFHKAVRCALDYNEFYDPKEVAVARALLKTGMERATQLREGKAPWKSAVGLVVRGYRSKIDGSVQPYGLVVPTSYQPNSAQPYRLDTWFHGRGEKLTELSFIDGRQKSMGEFTPAHTFVLHPYGRYCCANKFAGEVDLFEALAHAKKNYPIDENRIVVRGFSMGGAACWQYAVHHAGLWAAAAPGAGFSETAEFLKIFQQEKLAPTSHEQKLWHMYDCTDYARNLFNCPVVAYSGEKDSQKQAADIMEKALAKEGLKMVHIIGPDTAHKYHPQAKEEINRRIDSIAARGRNPVPNEVRFTTWTLRYNKMLWVTIDAVGEHWERAGVDAEIVDRSTVKLTTGNVTALTLSMPAGHCPLDNSRKPTVVIDGVKLESEQPLSDRSWEVHFHKTTKGWAQGSLPEDGLRKRHGLQGPIDDAFMDSFLIVRPGGKAANEKVEKWTQGELAHAVDHWRKQFRGEPRVLNDDAVGEKEIADHNLILFGDPKSNRVLAKLVEKLPIQWNSESVKVGSKSYSGASHTPVLIYPNPLNPKRYVVVNSGFTFREYDYLNNARQVSKLPDWAVIDLNVPVNSRYPGGIVNAGFFDEKWQVK